MELQPSRIHGILGPNGSGKSTLLKVIAAIWHPTSGEILYKGSPLHNLSRKKISQVVSMVPQECPLHFDYTVYEIVAMGRYPLDHRSHAKDRQVVKHVLKKVDGWHLRDRFIHTLSGGEKQRVILARSLATESPILLLDEPCTALDIRHQLQIWDLIAQLAKEGKTIAVSSHDFHHVERFCDDISVLEGGLLKTSGLLPNTLSKQIYKTVFGVVQIGKNEFEVA